ncbi:hypothetical protein E4U41_003896, partial [Claviceps citrina]
MFSELCSPSSFPRAMRPTLCLRLARPSAGARQCAARRTAASTRIRGSPSPSSPSLSPDKVSGNNASVSFASGTRAQSSSAAAAPGIPDAKNRTSRFAVPREAAAATAAAAAAPPPPPPPPPTTTTSSSSTAEAVSPFKQHRRDELRQDRESKDPLYPDPYPRLESCRSRRSVAEFLEQFQSTRVSSEEVTLNGRVRSKRVIGKGLVFLDVVNEFQKVQIMINKNKCVAESRDRINKFSLFKNLIQNNLADIPTLVLAVTGHAMRTKAGEPTLEASQMPQLIAPSMEQIPETLTDPKTRAAERHVDMLVNRESVDVLRLRAEVTRYLRDYFHSKRFLEFQTPILAEHAGGAVARPF